MEIVLRAVQASTAQPPDFETVNALYHPEHVLTSDWGVEGRSYHGAVISIDRGSTWHLIFAENYFGVNAAHELDSYLGPWALLGPRAAYFTGWCPVCGGESAVSGTTSLWVTKDGGRTFREYRIAALIGYEPVALRVSGRDATISAKGFFRGVWRRKTVTVHVE